MVKSMKVSKLEIRSGLLSARGPQAGSLPSLGLCFLVYNVG